MPTTIPGKQLQVHGTYAELQSSLLDRETGWCDDDNTLYYKKGSELIPVPRPLEGVLASAFDPSVAYVKDTFRMENGKLYISNKDIAANTPFSTDNWDEVPLSDYVELLLREIAPTSRGCIYFNKRTGNDDNDGLTRDTPVKTEAHLIELLRDHGFDRVYCTKTITNPSGSDDRGTSEIVVDTSVPYKWTRLIINGDGSRINVIFDTVSNVPAPASGINATISDVIIATDAAVTVSGNMDPLHLRVIQTGHSTQYKDEGVSFYEFNIDGKNTISSGRDTSLQNTTIDVESVGNVSGRFTINYNASQGYDFFRDRIGRLAIKSEKTVSVACGDYGFDEFTVDCASYDANSTTLTAASKIDINASANITLDTVYAGMSDARAYVHITGGAGTSIAASYSGAALDTSKVSFLSLKSILPPYLSSLGDNVWKCSPSVFIDWGGIIMHNGHITASTYEEHTDSYYGPDYPLSLEVPAYIGNNITNTGNAVFIDTKQMLAVERISATFRSGVRIKCNAFYPYNSYVIASSDIVFEAEDAIVSPTRDANFFPGYNVAADGRPSEGSIDYTIPSKVTIRSKNGSIQLKAAQGYGWNQEYTVEAPNGDVEFTNSIEVKILNIKAKRLVGTLTNNVNEAHIDVDTLVANDATYFYFYNYGNESGSYKWSDIWVTNSTICAKTLDYRVATLTDSGLIRFNSNTAGGPVRNVDVHIGTVICSLDWSSGKCCPLLGWMYYYNGEVSGEIGCIVNTYNGKVQKVTRWAKDLMFYNVLTQSDFSNLHMDLNSRVSLHFSEYSGPSDIYIDPEQGDDRYDGLTKGTAVKSIIGLYRCLKLNFRVSYDHTNYHININDPVTLHILSAGTTYGNRGSIIASGSPDLDFYINRAQAQDSDLGSNSSYVFVFGYLEILPEAPNLAVILRNVISTTVLYIHDFHGIGITGLYSNYATLQAASGVSINNDWSQNDYAYYNRRNIGPLNITAYDATLKGMFSNVRAITVGSVIITSTTGGTGGTDADCGLTGFTYIHAGDCITLGNSDTQLGISGTAYIEAGKDMSAYLHTILGVCTLKAANQITGAWGTGYMRCRLYMEAESLVNSNSNSTTFNGTSTLGNFLGNEIFLTARKSIGGTDPGSFYATSLYIKTMDLQWQNITLYGTNSVADFDATNIQSRISVYYMSKVTIRAQYFAAGLAILGGGPITPSAATPMSVYINAAYIGNFVVSLPTAESSTNIEKIIYANVGYCGAPALFVGNTTSSCRLYVTVNHSGISGDYAYSTVGKTLPSNFTGKILVLNDQKSLAAGSGIEIAEVSGEVRISGTGPALTNKTATIATGTTEASVTLDNDKYNIIDELDATATDLILNVPAVTGHLQECAFEFTLPASTALTTVVPKMRGRILPMIVPASFATDKIYQGTVVNGCVTIAELDKVIITVTNVQATNLTASSVDIEVTGTNITSDLEYELEFDMDGTTVTVNATGPTTTLTGSDFDAYDAATSVTVTPIINGETYTTYTLK